MILNLVNDRIINLLEIFFCDFFIIVMSTVTVAFFHFYIFKSILQINIKGEVIYQRFRIFIFLFDKKNITYSSYQSLNVF